MTTDLVNYLGIPVHGEITKSNRSSITQRPASEFAPLVRAALDAPGVEAIRWTQYTPYFNDGDECVFSASCYDRFVKLADVRPDNEEYDDADEDLEDFFEINDVRLKGGDETKYVQVEIPVAERVSNRWGGTPTHRGEFQKTGRSFSEHPAYGALSALSAAIEGGAFDDVLLDTFGDHAVVVVTREGITVDSYEHD